MVSRIQLRRGSAREWLETNPILAQGEGGVELDTGKIKIGNGVTTWDKLRYSEDDYRFIDGPVTTVNGRSGDVVVTAKDLGLDGSQSIPLAAKGAVNGVASLDSSGTMPVGQLPIVERQKLAADVQISLGSADNAAQTVVHGTSAGMSRPLGVACVIWIGPVEPANMTDNDLWIAPA